MNTALAVRIEEYSDYVSASHHLEFEDIHLDTNLRPTLISSIVLKEVGYNADNNYEIPVVFEQENDLVRLNQNYYFENPEEIEAFLCKNNFLIEKLLEIKINILKYFISNIVDVSLKYTTDPEDNFESLSVIIKTDVSPRLSLDTLNKFDYGWWLDEDYKFRELLSIVVRPL